MGHGPWAMDQDPSTKRFKSNNEELRAIIARFLVGGIPNELAAKTKVQNDIEKFRALFDGGDGLGFRTTIVQSPRKAVSIYLDSCECVDMASPKAFLSTMIGTNPGQADLETFYENNVRDIWCLLLLCQRIAEGCSAAIKGNPGGNDLAKILDETAGLCQSVIQHNIKRLPFDERDRAMDIRTMAAAVDHRVCLDQLVREFDRIQAHNSTLSNAMVRILFDFHKIVVKDVVYKHSHLPQYQRLSFYLYDPEIDELKPPTFLFMPCLHVMLRQGYEDVAGRMVEAFWKEMLKRGYFASASTRSAIEPNLTRYIESGLTTNPHVPLLVNAHFAPTYPLSFYFHGKSGAGKSSLVRSFGPSLNAVIMQFVDPEVMVRFVKQNLNKRHEMLRLELDLRPNNNDMSVMSIIQSRRMTYGQSKPGLVVVGFEEMPSCGPDRDPEQLTTCQLMSQRFAGRKGAYTTAGRAAPKGNGNSGISGDAAIVPIFTSNYDLEKASADALRKIEMFQQLCVVPMQAISGQDRANFAKHYVSRCLVEKGWTDDETASMVINVDVGEGDTRPLVRQLRMIAFYLNRFKHLQMLPDIVVVSQARDGGGVYIIHGGDKTKASTVELKTSDHGTLLDTTTSSHCTIDPDAATGITNRLRIQLSYSSLSSATIIRELSTILSFWLENALAPAVIVTQNAVWHQGLVSALLETAKVAETRVKVISSVDASQYKMMKSLYDDCSDATNTNLKDDIMALRGGGGGGSCFVAVDLICPTVDSQLCIREMIEDSTSQTAFSSDRSALHKNGLLFVVMIHGDVITPEVQSRASLIL